MEAKTPDVAGHVPPKCTTPILFGIDIEGSGMFESCSVIAIGCCVMHGGKKVDALLATGYTPDVQFEPRCRVEFWDSRPNHLLRFTAPAGITTTRDAQKYMISAFQAFRAKWELRADELGVDIQYVSDNPAYDIGQLNILIAGHCAGVPGVKGHQQLPMPYRASSMAYGRVWDSDSLAKGALAALNYANAVDCNAWGPDTKLLAHFGIPSPEVTHMPEEDAERHVLVASLALGYHKPEPSPSKRRGRGRTVRHKRK